MNRHSVLSVPAHGIVLDIRIAHVQAVRGGVVDARAVGAPGSQRDGLVNVEARADADEEAGDGVGRAVLCEVCSD